MYGVQVTYEMNENLKHHLKESAATSLVQTVGQHVFLHNFAHHGNVSWLNSISQTAYSFSVCHSVANHFMLATWHNMGAKHAPYHSMGTHVLDSADAMMSELYVQKGLVPSILG